MSDEDPRFPSGKPPCWLPATPTCTSQAFDHATDCVGCAANGSCDIPRSLDRSAIADLLGEAAAEALYPLPKVIALTGLAGAGKSSVANVLMLAHGYRRVRFAGPLKAMLKAIGLGEDEVDGPLKERPCALLSGHTPRHAMQTLGTEWGRAHLGPRFWVGLWQATAYDVLDHGGRVVVDDCRFPDEADAVRSVGGVIWRVTRPGLMAGPHRSERAMSAIRATTTIRNAGTLTELAVAVEAALTSEKP